MELLGFGVYQPKIVSKSEMEDFDFDGTLLTKEGIPVNLSDFKGKTLFINIWAAWCGPCRAEMPYINSLYEKLQDNPNIEFLMIAIDEDFEKSKDFVSGKNFTFPIYHAYEKLNSTLYTKSIPMTVVVSPEGNVLFHELGMNNFDTDDFRSFLINGGKITQ